MDVIYLLDSLIVMIWPHIRGGGGCILLLQFELRVGDVKYNVCIFYLVTGELYQKVWGSIIHQ